MIQSLKWNKYAVTGAAGFIGSHLAEELLKQGKYVVLIDDLSAGKKENLSFLDKFDAQWENQWEFHQVDVRDLDRLTDCFSDVDVVFHEAASKCTVCRVDPQKDLMINAMGAYNVFRAAEINGVKKVIHASTGSVFGGEPKSFYGVSKMAGEAYLRAFKEYNPDFNFTAIRYHHVFGPRQEWNANGGVIPIFITKILEGDPITVFGSGNQQRHFTYVKDLVEFNFKCESHYDGEYVNYANNMPTTLNELVQQLFEIMKSKVYVIHEGFRAGDIHSFDIKDNKYPKDLRASWAHTKHCLKETIEYYRDILNDTDRNQEADTQGHQRAEA